MWWFRHKKKAPECFDNKPEIAKVYDVNVSDIKITAQFASTRPGRHKLEGERDIYKVTGRFQNPCVLVGDNTLIDGYCTYVLAKRMGLTIVPCIYVGDEWRPIEAAQQDDAQHQGENVGQ